MNDGNGLYDNEGLLETLLSDLNKLPKLLMQNQYIAFCDLIAKMAQKIANLMKNVAAEKESLTNKVEELKRLNNDLLAEINKKDGVDNGCN